MNQQLLISKYKDYIKYLLHRQYITVEKKRQIYKMVCNMNKEIERLNNIINELEKWLEDMSNRTPLHISTITGFTMCLNKLQELKGNYNNE